MDGEGVLWEANRDWFHDCFMLYFWAVFRGGYRLVFGGRRQAAAAAFLSHETAVFLLLLWTVLELNSSYFMADFAAPFGWSSKVYGIFDTKEERMQQYVVKVQAPLARFWEWSITHIPREDNTEADALANLGSSTEMKGSESAMVVQLMNSVLDTDGPYHKIVEHDVVDFRWENIICMFRITKEIACDNGPQFIGAKVTKFLKDLKIKRITSSPYHPSANGQAESTNEVIIQNLKKRLEAAKGKWLEELPGVLWAYRTTAKSSIGETLFSLVYGAEALIPMEVGEPTLRYFREDEEFNNEAMLINLELLEERRDLARVRMEAQKQRMERYYNRRANFCYFKVGDLVLKKVTQNTGSSIRGS
ncbi:uncharacterized protein [Nicotiana tomentosiformis]|uniref:uncharacterized protein n=1 Tax=Nicotiana tomentosiformis TaxID=4098 RepID=UPI00388C7510